MNAVKSRAVLVSSKGKFHAYVLCIVHIVKELVNTVKEFQSEKTLTFPMHMCYVGKITDKKFVDNSY